MPVGAALASAAVTAGAGVYSANKASKASKSAMDASLAQQERVNSAAQPYIDAGQSALERISNPNDFIKYFAASPDFNFRLSEGMRAVGQNKAVNGLLRSGSALRAISDYGQNTAAGEFGNWWNRQSGLAGLGKSAVDTMAGVANSSQNAIMTNGANQGGAAIASGNAVAQGLGGIFDLIGKYGPTGNSGDQSSFSVNGQNISATPLPNPSSLVVT